jgi:hypothetical protein
MFRLRLAFLVLLFAASGLPGAAEAKLLGNEAAAQNCASAIGGSVTDSSVTVICGMPNEQVVQLVAALSSTDQRAKTAALDLLRARLPGDTQFRIEAIARFFEILGHEAVEPDRLADTFARIAEEHLDLRERLNVFQSADPEIDAYREQAAAALELGDHDAARAYLASARHAVREKSLALQAALLTHIREEARLIAEQADIERARLAQAEAAWLYEEAQGLVAVVDPQAALDYLEQAADAWFRHGWERGDNPALENSIALWRRAVGTRDRDGESAAWSAAQNRLGTALTILGSRQTGTKNLEAALAAFRAALEEATRERAPLDWARTQNNLGYALWILGDRDSDTERLEQAVAAYRAALEEATRERAPLDWAETQNNLGLSLWSLGERESGTASLEQAAAALRAALQERDRAHMPLDWAETQNNLAIILWKFGERAWGSSSSAPSKCRPMRK